MLATVNGLEMNQSGLGRGSVSLSFDVCCLLFFKFSYEVKRGFFTGNFNIIVIFARNAGLEIKNTGLER